MSSLDIVRLRLASHYLAGRPFSSPEDVVRHLGAVQAQEYGGAKWSLGLRMDEAGDSAIEEAFNEGRVVRTHVMRPTWHFVLPEDIKWMLALTAPRIKRALGYYDRKLELTDKLLAKCKQAIAGALEQHDNLTRQELGECISHAAVEASGQRLNHIVMHAELDALVCSGPRRGKQFTYMLLDKRAPRAKQLTREESLATLAGRYFQSHGPATLKDFTVWAGLSADDGRVALESVRRSLHEEVMGGTAYYLNPGTKPAEPKRPFALLLPVYDEYTIAYRDLDAYCEQEKLKQKLFAMGNALQNVMVLDGRIAGTWRRVQGGKQIRLMLSPLVKLSAAQQYAFEQHAQRYAAFFDTPTTAEFN